MSKLKVVIFGAGGVVGQHLIKTTPSSIEVIFTKRNSNNSIWTNFDITTDDVFEFLNNIKPDVIVNLAGENRVDVVESSPEEFLKVNVEFPLKLAQWVDLNNSYLIQCSTQGVFSGDNPKYKPNDIPHPITEYGKQKLLAEQNALTINSSEIVRFTFVLGVRPFPEYGRRNPLEDMIENKYQLQVDDRFFSPLFAQDCATMLWNKISQKLFSDKKIIHYGNELRCSRFSISSDVKYLARGSISAEIKPVSHEYFTGIAPRPKDTTWLDGFAESSIDYEEGILINIIEWSRLHK